MTSCKALCLSLVLACVASISLAQRGYDQRRYYDQRYQDREDVDYYGRDSDPYYNPRYRGYFYDQREYDTGYERDNFPLADEYFDSEYDPSSYERSEEARSAEKDEKKKVVADKKKDTMDMKNKKKDDNTKAAVALSDSASMQDTGVKKMEVKPTSVASTVAAVTGEDSKKKKQQS